MSEFSTFLRFVKSFHVQRAPAYLVSFNNKTETLCKFITPCSLQCFSSTVCTHRLLNFSDIKQHSKILFVLLRADLTRRFQQFKRAQTYLVYLECYFASIVRLSIRIALNPGPYFFWSNNFHFFQNMSNEILLGITILSQVYTHSFIFMSNFYTQVYQSQHSISTLDLLQPL